MKEETVLQETCSRVELGQWVIKSHEKNHDKLKNNNK